MNINVYDKSKYRNCRSKQYKVYFCMPPENTFIIDKVNTPKLHEIFKGKVMLSAKEVYDIKAKNISLFNHIMSNCDFTTKGRPVVFMDLDGGYRVASLMELGGCYSFQDNSAITEGAIQRLSKNGSIDWRPVISKGINRAIAMHVPLKNRGDINVNGIVLRVNNSGHNHGKGDFIVMDLDQAGRPNMATIRVINGIVFRETYDNRGWQDVLDYGYQLNTVTPESIIDDRVNTKKDDWEENMLSNIEGILQELVKTATKQLKFSYNREGNRIVVKAAVIVDYSKNNAITHKNESKDCKNLTSTIHINKQTKQIDMKYYNDYGDVKKLNFEINVPINEGTVNYLNENRYIIFGLMGYVKSNIRNNFQVIGGNYTKQEYDGIENYTISSSGMNRLNRGMGKDYERETGELRADLIRAINNMDSYLSRTTIVNDIPLYRGVPAPTACTYTGGTWDTLEGKILRDTAFNSTSLNIASTPMFAQTSKYKDSPDYVDRCGVVIALRGNVGIHAAHVHDIAGWREQFEVAVDRRYDIQLGKTIVEFKRLNGAIRVIEGKFVPHTPFGPIPSQPLNEQGKTNFDEHGKVSFEKENTEGVLHSAFNILRNKGYTSLTYQTKLGLDNGYGKFTGSSIVALSDSADEIVTDTAYTITSDELNSSLMKFKITGPREQLRIYWTDRNRFNGKMDYNFIWSTYDLTKDKIDSCSFLVSDLIPLSDEKPEVIAKMIEENIKYDKDIMGFPLQDIARYFNQIFAENIVFQGYELKGTIPVKRVGKEKDTQDGYVPLKFLIDGDNDESLLISIKMSRNNNKDLVIQYSGRSQNNRVNESDESSYNQFNSDIAITKAQEILQRFADKLNLSCTSKFRRVVNNWCVRRGFTYEILPVSNNESAEHREDYVLTKYLDNGALRYKITVNKTNDLMYNIGITNKSDNTQWIRLDSHRGIMDLCREVDECIRALDII